MSNKSSEFHYKQLCDLNGVKLTLREVDVIACILNGKTSKGSAAFLSISSKTVETHIYNAMNKLGVHSRQGIISYIEHSQYYSIFRKHYNELLIDSIFRKFLKNLSELKDLKFDKNYIFQCKDDELKRTILSKLAKHLTEAGIVVRIEELTSESDNGSILIKLCEKNSQTTIDLSDHTDYHMIFIQILRKITADSRTKAIVNQFEDNFVNLRGNRLAVPQISSSFLTEGQSPQSNNNHTKWILSSFVLLALFLTGLYVSKNRVQPTENNENPFPVACSELEIPAKSGLLERKELLSKIEETLKGSNDVKTVALIGIGGSGKTTLARQYARQQNSKIVWELNAETTENLKKSFKELALSCAKTKEEKKELTTILSIPDVKEREARLFHFIKRQLQENSGWTLIYDNVEKISVLKNCFPHNSKVWGNGKVIITTRSNAIRNNPIIDSKYINVGELTKNEEEILFNKIAYPNNKPEEAVKIPLKRIPPYPLDVSIIAQCIKNKDINFNFYKDDLVKSSLELEKRMKEILLETSPYQHTRHEIICKLLREIIQKNPESINLILAISTIDSQKIPQNILFELWNEKDAVNLLKILTEDGLINAANPDEKNATFSIHRSVQANILAFCLKQLQESDLKKIAGQFACTLEKRLTKAIEMKDYKLIETLSIHIQKFLTHKQLIQQTDWANLTYNLGIAKNLLGQYQQAAGLFSDCTEALQKKSNQNTEALANVHFQLGYTYRCLGKYRESISSIEECVSIRQDVLGMNHIKTAQALVELGNSNKHIGNFQHCKNYILKASRIYKSHFGSDHIETAWIYRNLGNIYKDLGELNRARNLMEKSIQIYNFQYGKGSLDAIWSSNYLGIIYYEIGSYKKAKVILQKAYEMSIKFYGENNLRIAWISQYLGNTYKKLKKYKLAKKHLEESQEIYQKYLKSNKMDWARNSVDLGDLYREIGQYDKALDSINKALEIFKMELKQQHPMNAWALFKLAQAHIDKSNDSEAERLLQEALQIYQSQNHSKRFEVLEALADIILLKLENKLTAAKPDEKKKAIELAKSHLLNAQFSLKKFYPDKNIFSIRINAKLAKLA